MATVGGVITQVRADLTDARRDVELVTRCITRSMSVPGATIRAMPGGCSRRKASSGGFPLAAPDA